MAAGLFFPLGLRIGGSVVTVIVDTHDGDRKKYYEEQKRKREELRAQLEAAFNAEMGIEPLVEAIAVRGPEPLIERVDYDALVADMQLWRATQEAAAAYWRFLEEDDEDVIFLSML